MSLDDAARCFTECPVETWKLAGRYDADLFLWSAPRKSGPVAIFDLASIEELRNGTEETHGRGDHRSFA